MSNKLLLALVLLATPLSSMGNISIQGSRVIYDQGQRDIDVHLLQVGTMPGFVQIWLDEGDATLEAQDVNPAFTLAPSIARMEPGGRQIVRIVHSRNDLPDDRESLLWFNVLETPLSSSGSQPGVRTRIKFFYRPRGLPTPPEKAHEALQFSLEPPSVDGVLNVRVYNPTPYHITFRELALQDAVAVDTPALAGFSTDAPDERMVAPMSELVLPFTRIGNTPVSLPAEALVRFSIINDYGGEAHGQRPLPPVPETGIAVQ